MKLQHFASAVLAGSTLIESMVFADIPWHPFEPTFHYLRIETIPSDGADETERRSYDLTVRPKIKLRTLGLSDGTFAWADMSCSDRSAASAPHECTLTVTETEAGATAPLNATISVMPGERVVAGELQKSDGKSFRVTVTAARQTAPPFDHRRPTRDGSTHVLYLGASRLIDGKFQLISSDMYEIHRAARIDRLASVGNAALQAEIECADRGSSDEAHRCQFQISVGAGRKLNTSAELAPGVHLDLGELELPDASRVRIHARAFPFALGGRSNTATR
jgi:hypothetical protein